MEQSDVWKTPWNTRNGNAFSQNDSEPVVALNAQDAMDYCAWLSVKTGRNWRLPTSAEWSAAVGTSTYPWGNNYRPPGSDGNYLEYLQRG
jgi:formylglycine-generating enzyme required for sulfatase activity